MNPLVYAECLKLSSERFDMTPSDLRRVMVNEVMAIEDELGVDLPEQYETFLIEVGAGAEFGGIGYWFHCDLTREGNLLRTNKQLWRGMHTQFEGKAPSNFLAVYDPCDGSLVGFKRRNGSFEAPMYGWSADNDELERLSDDFCSFLDINVDLSSDDVAEVELRLTSDAQAQAA